MRVGTGFSQHPDTEQAAAEAFQHARRQTGRDDPVDLVLLFATSQHDASFLRAVVHSLTGHPQPAILGGGAIGAFDNDAYGYSGAQIGLAAFWLDGEPFRHWSEGGLSRQEEAVGQRLGLRMARDGFVPHTPTLLFYDAVDWSPGHLRLNLATPLLRGLAHGLGFLPEALVGAGLQSDYECTPYAQWTGTHTVQQHAMALAFDPRLRMDSIILHGCRPLGREYMVTRADGPTLLEIDGQPALPYMADQLRGQLPPEEFPFFMIFGIDRGPGDGEFVPAHYQNRLCLAIDPDRNGIVMFESDMVAGTPFRIMYRSLDMEYIPPQIDALFDRLADRRPLWAFYIDCGGRTAEKSGTAVEDAVVVQRAVGGRVPLLGAYTGVEIAPVMGVPSPLDWTGVFCVLSE